MSYFSQFEPDLSERSYPSHVAQLVMRLQELREKGTGVLPAPGSSTLNESDLKYAPPECISSLPDIRRAAEMCEDELYSTWHLIYLDGTVWEINLNLPPPEGFAAEFEILSRRIKLH